MAPIMAAATSRPKKQAAQTGRVVKRPARGFHRFRNGIMNVTPKGGEKELVKNNQESFLLKVPGELRHKIWEFAIGVNLFRPTSVQITQTIWARRMVPRITDREHALALLQTCRQIYAETARLPYKSGILNAVDYRYIKRDLSYLKPFQRAQFSELRLEAYHENLLIRPDPLITDLSKKGRYNLDFPPGLKCIRVVIFKKHIWVGHNIASLVAGVRARLDLVLVGKNIAITVEIVDVTPEEYCDFNEPLQGMDSSRSRLAHGESCEIISLN
ncbi:hypothetical protein HBI25_120040 [Parastagonospora nodorum]|nr:hypothetical protein HBH82_037200 [Parastagonospora nodorum]KAH4693515.1 hypothetical protein HBH78_073180 [Parastagonospora nodorum]KAH4700485.1 hypothetical protein HBH67_143880 [Parastagonospora nodorum]KAH4789432.1 hypothetical protein HBH62_044370 [Parastagonospora nodorum]KAH4791777.1 hypothetical protein HBH63_100070 [Parastagonospora nodorum]